ncbi:MAG TPA: glycosyltransferase family 4 protein [Gaiellaceae bacterium]|nr:glycosyltransferase family 4 protein [Gaiellaceae bacterium]
MATAEQIRTLHSFPHRIGAGRICTTAWYEVAEAAAAGVNLKVLTASVQKPLPHPVVAYETLAWRNLRLPFRLVGDMRMFDWHDRIVARYLTRASWKPNVVHAWPGASVRTLEAARELGIASVLERPNAHTRFAYRVVAEECERIGVPLPRKHEHAFNAELLAREESEYELADFILCPSEFVRQTFVDAGVPAAKLIRHFYGYDERVFFPAPERRANPQFTALFVGVAAVRKGLHFALEAWLRSPARESGKLRIAGEILPAYAERLRGMLSHPSVEVLGHSTAVPELMRDADVFVLPSIEEGFGLVCTEAMASGAVPLVSAACTDLCQHNVNALVHEVGNVQQLTEHLTAVYEDRSLLERLRAGGLETAPSITWSVAGRRLREIYASVSDREDGAVPAAA